MLLILIACLKLEMEEVSKMGAENRRMMRFVTLKHDYVKEICDDDDMICDLKLDLAYVMDNEEGKDLTLEDYFKASFANVTLMFNTCINYTTTKKAYSEVLNILKSVITEIEKIVEVYSDDPRCFVRHMARAEYRLKTCLDFSSDLLYKETISFEPEYDECMYKAAVNLATQPLPDEPNPVLLTTYYKSVRIPVLQFFCKKMKGVYKTKNRKPCFDGQLADNVCYILSNTNHLRSGELSALMERFQKKLEKDGPFH